MSGDQVTAGTAEANAADESLARRATRRRALTVTTLLALAGFGAVAISLQRPAPAPHAARPAPTIAGLPLDPEAMQVSDPAALQALTQDEARAANAARPAADQLLPPARGLMVPRTDPANYDRSLDCMTAAIYYEAAVEPEDGQRAVAQVILNRLRHPAYPHSVCGVVFQGFQRQTGCQFTFSCDGALARAPNPLLWSRARKVAEAALSGFVYKPVSLATHYHANYVVPYWADSLLKVSTIGQHIFYRFNGVGPASFSVAYAGSEPNLLNRDPGGLLTLNGQLSASEMAAALPVTPDLRPLSLSGAVIAKPGDAAKPEQSGTPAAKALAAPAAGDRPTADPGQVAPAAADRRFVIGMDGAARRSAPASESAKPPPR